MEDDGEDGEAEGGYLERVEIGSGDGGVAREAGDAVQLACSDVGGFVGHVLIWLKCGCGRYLMGELELWHAYAGTRMCNDAIGARAVVGRG